MELPLVEVKIVVGKSGRKWNYLKCNVCGKWVMATYVGRHRKKHSQVINS